MKGVKSPWPIISRPKEKEVARKSLGGGEAKYQQSHYTKEV